MVPNQHSIAPNLRALGCDFGHGEFFDLKPSHRRIRIKIKIRIRKKLKSPRTKRGYWTFRVGYWIFKNVFPVTNPSHSKHSYSSFVNFLTSAGALPTIKTSQTGYVLKSKILIPIKGLYYPQIAQIAQINNRTLYITSYFILFTSYFEYPATTENCIFC